MTSCSTRGTFFLCLEVISFSPTGLDAASGTLVPLLFLGLEAMLYEGTASSLSFTQPRMESLKCKGPFLDNVQAQVEAKTLGLLVIVLKGLGLVHRS